MTVDKSGMLSSCEVHFEVVQEFTTPENTSNGNVANIGGGGGGRDEREKERERMKDKKDIFVEKDSKDKKEEKEKDIADVNSDDGNQSQSNSNNSNSGSGSGSGSNAGSHDSRSLLNAPTAQSHGINNLNNNNGETASLSSTVNTGRRRSSIFSDRARSRSRERSSSHKDKEKERENGGIGAGGLAHALTSKSDKSLLGRVKLNLAEYVNEGREDEGVVRRYLMQDSKINSTLRIGISMRLVEGENNFVTLVSLTLSFFFFFFNANT